METDFGKIAPCGINCSLCLGYLRDKNRCDGCLAPDGQKYHSCQGCLIKNCARLAQTGSKFCYECEKFPCPRLKHLEKRYRLKYHVQIFENFRAIKELGEAEFTRLENEKWKCPECGGTICMHRGYCLGCKKTKRSKP